MKLYSPALAALGIKSRHAWAVLADIAPSLLSRIVDGKQVLTEVTRRRLAEAAAVDPAEVDDLLLSTSPELAVPMPSGRNPAEAASEPPPPRVVHGLMILCGGHGLDRKGAT